MQFALANIVVKEMPFAEQCADLASIGYDGIEVAPSTLSDEPDRMAKRARTELRRAAEDAGIAIFGFNFLIYHPPGLSITDPDDAVRARTVDLAKRTTELLAKSTAATSSTARPRSGRSRTPATMPGANAGSNRFAPSRPRPRPHESTT